MTLERKNKKETNNLINPPELSWLPNISYNLKKFKGFAWLDLDAKKLLKESINPRRLNIPFKNQFYYNGATVLAHDYKRLQKSAKYILILDKLLNRLSKYYPYFDKKRLGQLFLNNFADFGSILIFSDFCIRKKISIEKFEPDISNSGKKADFKIRLFKRLMYIEVKTPIESYLKGGKIEEFIKSAIKDQIKLIKNYPTILMITIADPNWSNNILNGGLISDFMFFQIQFINHCYNDQYSHPQLSAVFIKYGDRLDQYYNETAEHPISKEEKNFLLKKFFKHRFIDFTDKIKDFIIK